jgi:hypothetical protein
MIEALTADPLIDCECTSGEGPVWEAATERVVVSRSRVGLSGRLRNKRWAATD